MLLNTETDAHFLQLLIIRLCVHSDGSV